MRRLLFGLLFCSPLFTFCANGQNSGDNDLQRGFYLTTDNQQPVQNVVVPALPKEAYFAGEKVPLEYFDVREALQREIMIISYQHGSLSYIMQLAGRYKELVDKILKEEGVPEDFFYLCVAESMLQPLSSPANARGYWQILAGTAKENGLEVSAQVDERYNWEKSTKAACKYLKKAYAKYGSWALAAASYNTGMSNVDERMRYQSLDNYFDMQFVPETARYVYRIIAYKTIMGNPKAYGFNLNKEDLYKPFEYKIVEVKGPIANWSEFAAKHNTNFKMIKMMNEWIRSNKLDNPARKTYQVKVPVEGSRQN